MSLRSDCSVTISCLSQIGQSCCGVASNNLYGVFSSLSTTEAYFQFSSFSCCVTGKLTKYSLKCCESSDKHTSHAAQKPVKIVRKANIYYVKK